MPVIHDDEFGDITVRRSNKASEVRVRVAPDGTLRASLPLYAPLFLVKRLLKASRPQLRELIQTTDVQTDYVDGMDIGKSHHLSVRTGSRLTVTRHGQSIVVVLPEDLSLNSPRVSRLVRDEVIEALRKEAKSYLPRRLAYIADSLGFEYQKVRFSHASGRWGSCSSTGTISLNIALMKLPFELIDYVLTHELAHTREMNHSDAFWKIVAVGDPAYKQHRRALKNETPSI